MSSRFLRRLREEAEVNVIIAEDDNGDNDDDDDDDDDDDEEHEIHRRSTFAFLSNIESESDSETDSNEDKEQVQSQVNRTQRESKNEKYSLESGRKAQDANEDIDLILSEFHKEVLPMESKPISSPTVNSFSFLLENIDIKDFDIDFVLRNMVNGIQADGNRKKRKRGEKMFCQPRAEWGKKPETFVGGGLGMEFAKTKIDKNANDYIPWPYGDSDLFSGVDMKVYRFHRSEEYANLIQKYEAIVSSSGDINTLAMFIADYPFIVEPLFQFSMFLFSVGENDQGIGVLKRCLWIMECAALPSLFDFESNDIMNLVNFDLEENQVFFNVLFRYAQTSCTLGCPSTSW